MSFIDTGRHELCGHLADLPLYHPLETYAGEFSAGPGSLVLGGGSGEFAAVVFDPVAAAANFIEDYAHLIDEVSTRVDGDRDRDHTGLLDTAGHLGVDAEALFATADRFREKCVGRDRPWTGGAFGSWSGDDWAWVVKHAKRTGTTPYRRRTHGSIENWLSVSLGEYVVVSFADLLAPVLDVDPAAATAVAALRQLAARRPLLGNVTQLPSGYLTGGRGATFNEPNMRH